MVKRKLSTTTTMMQTTMPRMPKMTIMARMTHYQQQRYRNHANQTEACSCTKNYFNKINGNEQG
jgi:hypothetical protein